MQSRQTLFPVSINVAWLYLVSLLTKETLQELFPLTRKKNKQTKQVMYLKAERAVADEISRSDGELSSNKFG